MEWCVEQLTPLGRRESPRHEKSRRAAQPWRAAGGDHEELEAARVIAPVSYDLNLALRFGTAAVHAVELGNFGCKHVPTNGDVVGTARHLWVSFGD